MTTIAEAMAKLARPLYQPVEVPPYDQEPALQPCVERWEMMRPHLPKPGTMVDYGSHTGWFVRRFAREGWTAIGIEKSPDYMAVAMAIPTPNTIYLMRDIRVAVSADVTLCLSTAMYLFDDVEKGWSFFRRVSESSPMLFADFGGQYAHRLPFDESNVVAQMLERTTYTKGTLPGRTGFESRPFYLFQR